MRRWFHSSCFNAGFDTANMSVLELRHSNLTTVSHDLFKSKEGKALEEVYLDANQLRDLPRGLFNLQNLQVLGLSDNELTILPSVLSNLVNLRILDFSKNGIIDIPETIKHCKNLQEIDASVNPIGKIPETFCHLANLTHLYLNDAFLDFLPGNFGRLISLRILELRENHLRVLPKSMSQLKNLERLDIGNNEFTELPMVVGCLLNLTELWMDSNAIKELRPEIGLLRRLMFLDVSKNRLEWLPPEIESLQSLTDLYLSNNLLIEIPEQIGALGKLQTLKLEENHLGELPNSIGKLVELEELILTCNELVSLPPSLGYLRKLRVLNIDENFLESIPSELGSCTAMTILSLRDNRLVHLPDSIGRMPKLQVINLASNRLEYLPYSFHKLVSLKALWLSENQSKPMIPLQSDYNTSTNTHILTCYMFPQEPLSEEPEDNTSMNSVEIHPEADDGSSNLADVNLETGPPHRSSIVFDIDENDYLARLARFSSPYPKDVKDRAMQYLASRRQQQQQHQHQDKNNNPPQPSAHHQCQHDKHRDHHHDTPHYHQPPPPPTRPSHSCGPHPVPPTPLVQHPEPEAPPQLPPPPPFIVDDTESPQEQPPTTPVSPLQQLLLKGRIDKQEPEEEQKPVFGLPSQMRGRSAAGQGRSEVVTSRRGGDPMGSIGLVPQGRDGERIEGPQGWSGEPRRGYDSTSQAEIRRRSQESPQGGGQESLSRGRVPEVPWYEDQSHHSSDTGSMHSDHEGPPRAPRNIAVVAPSRLTYEHNQDKPDNLPSTSGRLLDDNRSISSQSSVASYGAIPPPVYQTIPRGPATGPATRGPPSSSASSHMSQHSFREGAPSLETTMQGVDLRVPPTGEWMRMPDTVHGQSYEETHSFRSEEPSIVYEAGQPILRPPSYHEAMGQRRQPTDVTVHYIFVDQLRPSALGLIDNAPADEHFSPPPGYSTIDPRDRPQATLVTNGTSDHVAYGRQPVARGLGYDPSLPPDIDRFESRVREIQQERREERERRGNGYPVDSAPPPVPSPPGQQEEEFHVTVHKNPNLGFSVAGGVGSTGNPFDPADETSIYVTKVQPEGPAAFGLKPGDKILEVNGINLRNTTHDRAVLFLKNNQVVDLLVSRAKAAS